MLVNRWSCSALQQPLRVELARERADGEPERERRERAVPQAVAPGRRRRTEEAVAGPQAGAVQRGEHQRDDRAMRVLDRLRQFARRARRVLKDRESSRAWSARTCPGSSRAPARNCVVGDHDLRARNACGHRRLLGVGDQQLRRAVLHAQADAVRPEQREQRHRDRADLDGAEDRDVERPRRLEHDGDAVARLARLARPGSARTATTRARCRRSASVSSRPSACARITAVRSPSTCRSMHSCAMLSCSRLPSNSSHSLLRRPVLLRVGVGRVFGELGHGRTGASRNDVLQMMPARAKVVK